MILITEKCSIEGVITLQNNNFPSDTISFPYNEEKYPGGAHFQAKEWLINKGYKVLGHSWDELNTCHVIVVETFTFLLQDN